MSDLPPLPQALPQFKTAPDTSRLWIRPLSVMGGVSYMMRWTTPDDGAYWTEYAAHAPLLAEIERLTKELAEARAIPFRDLVLMNERQRQDDRAELLALLRNLVSAAKAWGEARWFDDDDSTGSGMHDAGADVTNAIEAADRYLAALARQKGE